METKITMSEIRPKANTPGLVISTGVISAIAMMIYFLIMRSMRLHYVVELHYLNVLFIFIGVAFAIHRHKKVEGRIKYLDGLGVGFLTILVSSLTFTLLLVSFMYYHPTLTHYLSQRALLSDEMGPMAIAGMLFAEGITSGIICTYIAMQYFRTRA